MSKAFLLMSALLLGGAAIGLSSPTVLAAEADSAAAASKACEQDAARQHYVGKKRSRFIRQCLAKRITRAARPWPARTFSHPIRLQCRGRPRYAAAAHLAPPSAARCPATRRWHPARR